MMSDQDIKSLLGNYWVEEFMPDELTAGQSFIQPHWEQLLKQIQRLGKEEIELRNQEIQHILRESGVTYNSQLKPEKSRRIWEMDPIPFLISPDTWEDIHDGVQQRAQLLDLVFKDLYGPRRLFKEGILPPELIFADGHFLRACDQLEFGERYAILQYGVDISRGPSGQIWVIGDRTQAPSGMAYALENRVTLARVLPELFAKAKVKKIVPFFQSLRENFLQAAPHQARNPLVALLTPGPYNATYFEHAFLASLQGFQLVQGQDLMVKDNFLWLKTLNGLEKVDVLVRHVDDDFSDPLSLRADSQLGVAGLLEVARKGNVTLANPLGSGVLENPGLMAFMPSICKFFLKEDLKLPNIASWWCGQEKELQYVLKNLDQLVIKDIHKRRGRRTIFGWELDKAEKAALVERIKASPYRFVGQEQAIFSTVPGWSNKGLEPRKAVFRCFASAAKHEYQIMPGGLSRIAPSAGNSHVSNRSGGIGKDTWIISAQKVQPIRYNPREQFDAFSYEGLNELPSRMGENLFWCGRYLMRVRISARYLRILLKYQIEIENFEDYSDQSLFKILLPALTHLTMTYPGFVGEEGEESLQDPQLGLEAVLRDYNLSGSLAHSIKMMKNAANSVRTLWAGDTWRIIDVMDTHWEDWCQECKTMDPREERKSLDQLITHLAAVQGFTNASLSVEEGRPLFELGMDIERSLLMSSLFRSLLSQEESIDIEDNLLEVLLLTLESLSSYRHRYRGRLMPEGVLELTLLDDSYPQSLSYSLKNIHDNMAKLPSILNGQKYREDQKSILKALSRLQLAEAKDLAQLSSEENFRKDLEELLSTTYQDLADASNAFINTYFSHTYYEAQRSIFSYEVDV